MDEFFNYFFGFDKAFNYDSLGCRTYKHITKDDKEILAVNVAGFTKEDIELTTKTIGNTDYLYISTTPKEDVKDFVSPFTIRFAVRTNVIGSIDAEVKDGMLYITVTKKENKPNIKINFK
jgi:HSP20 family molecular chaperone IbpA